MAERYDKRVKNIRAKIKLGPGDHTKAQKKLLHSSEPHSLYTLNHKATKWSQEEPIETYIKKADITSTHTSWWLEVIKSRTYLDSQKVTTRIS